ncbi:GNAT family N-acetyltransferase [Sulfuriferula sp. AH1]|uniref:GNAT family N-acetyltransferase n=1 Tax=Sulfuriferula sp. AH1 TaxID=1985873 RepID=UPI000B3B4D4A|nr:GNAT family N-acetyltransferase [Sulfuriferula sp. AH1]ARU31214.1 GNAT family N-acetyltransferase [Sulfuriferula sp. AH1]
MTEEILVVNSDSALLQAAFALRREVFVVEQNVPLELEIDEHDTSAIHFVMKQNGKVVATLRLLSYGDQIKIGRVAVKQPLRRQGLGTKLMLRGIRYAAESGFSSVILDAQVISMPFYHTLGFIKEGTEFDDAGIPHMRMVLRL